MVAGTPGKLGWGHEVGSPSQASEGTSSAGTSIFGCQLSEWWDKTFLSSKPPSLWSCVTAALAC